MNETQLKLTISAEKGTVSALLCQPERAIALLILAHGAGANMLHPHMQSLASSLYEREIATLRYNFPFMENSRKGRDSRAITLQTIRAAVSTGRDLAGGLPCLAGGHSFGGRMTSVAQAENPLQGIQGLVFFSFPLHPAGQPGLARVAHFTSIALPMLFISGTRDKLANPELLTGFTNNLAKSCKLHYLQTADHGFTILKRQRKSTENIYAEAAGVASDWIRNLT